MDVIYSVLNGLIGAIDNCDITLQQSIENVTELYLVKWYVIESLTKISNQPKEWFIEKNTKQLWTIFNDMLICIAQTLKKKHLLIFWMCEVMDHGILCGVWDSSRSIVHQIINDGKEIGILRG